MKYKNQFLILILLLIIGLKSHAQSEIKWDVIIDSLTDNRSQLYSKTKLFIGETWKSAQNVIQNDDKEAGIILVKGITTRNMDYQLHNHRWTFAYSVKFFLKDHKCRIVLDNIYCESARYGQYEQHKKQCLPILDKYPAKKGNKITGLNEKKYVQLIISLRMELQAIVDSYKIHINEPLIDNPDW